jgi:hypothetical protein
MKASRPKDQRVTLFKRENGVLLAQDERTGSGQDEFVGVRPSMINALISRNKESGIAGFDFQSVLNMHVV